MIFDVFKSQRKIVHISVISPERVDGVTGKVIPEESARSLITGSLHDGERITSSTPLPKSPGSVANVSDTLVDLGSRSIHTSTPLSIDDRLEITEPDGTVTLWEVTGKIRSYDLITKLTGTKWHSFALKLVSNSVNITDTPAEDQDSPGSTVSSNAIAVVAVDSAEVIVNGTTIPDNSPYPVPVENWT